ncbi:protein-tyrosine phosphatase-like protein, partial [Chytridium lagenaria]
PRFFSWLVPLVIAGISTPKCAADVRALKTLGIRTVITLTEEEPLPEKWFDDAIVRHHFWPVRNYHPPCVSHADQFIRIVVDAVHGKDRHGVLVHCGGGKGRAGSLLATYLVRFGLEYPVMNATDAVTLLRRLRPGSIETERQEKFVADY